MRDRNAVGRVRIAWATVTLGAAAVFAPTAWASDGSVAGRPALPASSTESSASLTLGVGAARIDEDGFARIAPGFVWVVPDVELVPPGDWFGERTSGTFRVQVGAPLHLRFADGAPKQGAVVREEDWDEVSDWFRLVPHIEYATPWDPLYLRAGFLSNVRIGHRTVVDNFMNSVDIDRFRWGVHANVATVHGGVETVVDHVVEPGLAAMRAFVRPFSLFAPASWWSRLAIGATVAGDVSAPARLAIRTDGTYVVGPDGFAVERADATGIVGIDAELQVVSLDWVALTPYVDHNRHLGLGSGTHAGLMTAFRLGDVAVVDTRAEVRFLSGAYLPGYFDSLYEAQRHAYLPARGGSQRLPKLRWLRVGEQRASTGYLAELGVDLGEAFRIAAGWEDTDGRDDAGVWLQTTVSIEAFTLGGWYSRRGFDRVSEAFSAEDSLLVAEARYAFGSWWYAQGQLGRRWRLQEDGGWRSVDDFALGVGANWGF